jgi:hypothetical protein
MRHSVPAIDSFERGSIFAHVVVRLVDFVGGIRMHPLEPNIAVCSQFAGDSGSNSWCRGVRVNTRLRVCEWETATMFDDVLHSVASRCPFNSTLAVAWLSY